MISVVIPADQAEETLARVFAPLVSATVEGLVREVVLLDQGLSSETGKIAEMAGARVVKDLTDLRGNWVLHLSQDCVLEPGWNEEIVRFFEAADTGRALGLFRWRNLEAGPIARLQELRKALAARWLKALSSEQAFLFPSEWLGDNARPRPQSLKGRRIVPLRSRATRIS